MLDNNVADNEDVFCFTTATDSAVAADYNDDFDVAVVRLVLLLLRVFSSRVSLLPIVVLPLILLSLLVFLLLLLLLLRYYEYDNDYNHCYYYYYE